MNKTVIEVQVRAVLPTSGGCAVFLGNNDKVFIIYVDQTVGSAITMFMREISKERPLTHDLMAHLMTALGAQVERVIINDLKNATYYARMIIRAENELQQKKDRRTRWSAERLHRDGDAAKGADLRQPGSLGRSRRHERRPPQDGRGRTQAGSGRRNRKSKWISVRSIHFQAAEWRSLWHAGRTIHQIRNSALRCPRALRWARRVQRDVGLGLRSPAPVCYRSNISRLLRH